jgi:hypothetical protein
VPRGQRDESLRPYYRLSRPEPLLFLLTSSSVALTRLSGPHSRPTTFFFFSCSARESNPGPQDLQPGTLTTRPQRRSDHKKKKKNRGLSPRANYTERPPLVREVGAKFYGWKVPHSQRDISLRSNSRFYRPVN